MPLLFVRISRFVIACRTKHHHVATRILLLRLQSNATRRSQHATLALRTAKTSIKKHHHRPRMRAAQLGIKAVQRIATLSLLTIRIHRQQISIARRLIRNAMPRIIKHNVQPTLKSSSNVLNVAYGTQHRAKRSIRISAHIATGHAQSLFAILSKHRTIV